MPGPNPQIRIGVEMDPQSREKISGFVEDLKRRVKELEKTRGSDDPELQRLREIHKVVKDTASAQGENVSRTRTFAGELRTSLAGMERMAQNLNVLGGAGGAAAGGVISGGAGILAGGGVLAAITAVTAVIGMAMKMGLEFERTSTRAAQALDVGVGRFRTGYAAVRSAAYAGEPYGIGVHEMSQAVGVYGLARGATAEQAAAAAKPIAQYSRGYGVDPTLLANMVGTITATTQESAARALSSVFGAAEGSGPMGRRITEFVGTATNVLSSLQIARPGETFTTGDAASLVRNIARLGGIYGSQAGVQMTVAAGQGLTGGMGSNLQKMAFGVRAGITNPVDLILENNDPGTMRRMIAEAIRESGGRHTGALFAANLVGLEGGNANAARSLYYAINSPNAPKNVLDIFNSKTGGAAPVEQRDKEYLSTTLSHFERASAKIEDTVTAWGDNINNFVGKGLDQVTQALGGVADAANQAAAALYGVAGPGGGPTGSGGLIFPNLGGPMSWAEDALFGLQKWYHGRAVNPALDAIFQSRGNKSFAYKQPLLAAAGSQGLPWDVFASLIAQESSGRPNALNPSSGAQGIAQFMPATAKAYGINAFDPLQALPAAAKYLRSSLNHYGGNMDLALMSYVWGTGNLDAHLRAHHNNVAEAISTAPAEVRDYAQEIEDRAKAADTVAGQNLAVGSATATIPTEHGRLVIRYEPTAKHAHAAPMGRTHSKRHR